MVDSSGGDEGFRYYVDDSVDPGNAMLIATVIFCLLLIAALPFMVVAGQRFVKHEDCQDDATDDNEECSPVATKSSELGLTKTGSPKSELRPDLSFHTGSGISPYHRRNHDDSCSDDEDGDDGKNLDAASDDGSDQSFKTGAASVTSTLLNAILETSPHGGPIMRRNQLHIRRREVQLELEEEEDRKSEASHSVLGIISQDEVSIRDAVDASTFVQQDTMDLMNNKGNWMEKLLVIAEWDYEARRISKLGFPFVLQALAIGITEAIRVALIGKFIGTRALSAYVIVTMVVGMSNVFLKGFQDACITLCSHAVGVGNKRLAGQYIQIGTTLFTICFIPIFVCWVYATGPIFTWLGFDAATRKMGEEFALLYMFSSFLHGIDHSMHSLLDVIDKEVYSTVFVSSQEIVATLATLAVVLQPNVTNLQLLGLAYIGQKALALILNSAIIVWNGWFDKYLDGLVGNFALLNVKATKVLLGTSLALSFGELIAYGEWELLTVFASVLGPAEVAAWGILGTLWDALELVTEAVADAGEVRTGFLLGAGRPAQAKLSSMKTLYLGIFVSILITSCMFIAGESIPTWMTNDPTLQRMIAELIPLFGIGNIALSLGTLSWTLVGSQSRYRLSTTVGLSGAWFVAIPLATILTIVYNVDLQGQTAAIVIGYMVSGTANSYILLQTDWPKQSRRVIAQAGGIIVDDGDDNDSSSSSSSSSNDASSDGTDAEQIEAIVNNSATTAMSVPKANTTNISSATNKASKNVTPISDVNDNPAPSNEMNASSHASKKSTNTTDKLTPPTVKTRIVSISKSEDSGALASNRKEKLNDESRVSSTSSGSKTVPRRNRAKDRGSMKTEERNIGSVSDVAPVGDSIQRIRPVVVSKRRKNLDPNTVKSAK